MTLEEIYEVMRELSGNEPNEIIECEDGFVMSFGKSDFDEE